ncbi:MAG: flippase-like domain-containing protein [Ignavibacteriales bacterium]|nr:flippase-like domain-containing protein [Ignavibacteriales bacterium]
MQSPSSEIWSKGLFAGRILIGIVLFYLVLQLVSLPNVIKAFEQARLGYVFFALFLLGANVGIQIIKWHYFLRLADSTVTLKQATTSLLFGITLGSFTPGQVGELGGRALRHTGEFSAQIIGFTIIDKLQMFLVMGMGGIVGFIFLFSLPVLEQVMISVGGTLIFLILFFRPSLLKQIVEKIPFRIVKHEWVEDFLRTLTKFHSKELLYSLALTVIFYAVIWLQMFLLLNAFSPVGPWQAFLGYAAMMFSKALLPISLGDLGIREVSSVYFFSRIGIPETTALNAAFLLFVINMVVPALAGLFFLPKLKLARGSS